jgi:hypothetical protein
MNSTMTMQRKSVFLFRWARFASLRAGADFSFFPTVKNEGGARG